MSASASETARLYGGVIAVVSGLYSLFLASTGMSMMTGAWWFMALLGLVVLVHGVLLFGSPETLGGHSGPLMIVWAVLMLLNQAWLGSPIWMAGGSGYGMDGGMGGPMGGNMDGGTSGGMGGSAGMMGWDPGMVAIAVIMLASGLLMWTRSDESGGM